jgi:hypothetical protein
MSASQASRAEWLNNRFWEHLDLIESRHRRVLSMHDSAWRALQLVLTDSLDQHSALQYYCDVVAELDRVTAELEEVRARGV